MSLVPSRNKKPTIPVEAKIGRARIVLQAENHAIKAMATSRGSSEVLVERRLRKRYPMHSENRRYSRQSTSRIPACSRHCAAAARACSRGLSNRRIKQVEVKWQGARVA